MRFISLLPFLSLSRPALAKLGFAAQLFQLQGDSAVTNAKLEWATVAKASSYRVERSSNGGSFSVIATVPGNTHDDYDLKVGQSYRYRVVAIDGSSTVDQSSLATLSPFTPSGTYSSFDNVPDENTASVAETSSDASTVKGNVKEYRYQYQTFSNRSFSHFTEQVSENGGPWTGNRTVLTNIEMCASANYSCKLERIQWTQHPSTGQYVMWGHFERAKDYGLGYVCNLYTDPGAPSLTFNGAYRPLGHDSRDMTLFSDGDAAYLISATNVNADMVIFNLTSNWTAVASELTTVSKGQYREAPAVIKSNGWYYIFTSRASGWVPSQPQYIMAENMAGPWSNGVNVANTATFASQSGGVAKFPNGQFTMYSDRWSSNWPIPGGPTRQLNLPLALDASGQYATYHFYPQVKYAQSTKPDQAVYGIQNGKILSDNKPALSNAGSANISLANDGTQNDPNKVWIPSKVPFWYQVDLRDSHKITRIDLTTKLRQGSETFYNYTISASKDNQTFTTIADKRDNKDPGFSTVLPTSTEGFRYVRLNVNSVINAINGNSASWAVGVHEFTVFGN
ncbi:uncharacterized protein NECHADRAFT_87046 [Fusarium vanettenii 77-13-4]|uniref:F5/8 type C domain-containing protein n=1 Tax=Fusarium vanettenii (strain ATCC MYA-4622 / CBS 123669 / FGSC 9596 / NRRL 45880 / 77-13-4) TaxID=660122 RepID=C7ZNH8_FUSV7|nr:uncharacterized protein NECHADRAFT_87046 [Fusarium vanettenii 77-13-4]EEU34436.1 hypothetical protein NECHADRAFT_87046 [Fusarium vanettenii 77-13-4]